MGVARAIPHSKSVGSFTVHTLLEFSWLCLCRVSGVGSFAYLLLDFWLLSKASAPVSTLEATQKHFPLLSPSLDSSSTLHFCHFHVIVRRSTMLDRNKVCNHRREKNVSIIDRLLSDQPSGLLCCYGFTDMVGWILHSPRLAKNGKIRVLFFLRRSCLYFRLQFQKF